MSRLPIVCGDTDAPLPELPSVSDPIPLAARGEAGFPGWLADNNGRQLKYLRLSVTDRCDLKCHYCMPAEGIPASAREELLSFEDIVRVAKVFKSLGVKTIRLTGGEPLIRRGIVDLISMLRNEAGIEDIAMTSNATALDKLSKPLVEAGLKRINISLDSVNEDTFRHLTRGGNLKRVIRGIDAIIEAGIREIKTNSVVIRDQNHQQLSEIVRWAWDRGITPRFIELMPLGEGARLGAEAVVPVAEMKEQLGELIAQEDANYRLDRGPAGYLSSPHNPEHKVGFIGAVTDNFCHRCNRVRVTAKGEIRACLASPSGFSLKEALKQNSDLEEITQLVRAALFGKKDGHEFYVPGQDRHHAVDMSRIGG